MLSILERINNFSFPTEKDYEIDIIQFYKICKSLESEGYICNMSNLTSFIDGSYAFSLESAEITTKGMKYIEENKVCEKQVVKSEKISLSIQNVNSCFDKLLEGLTYSFDKL